MSEDTETIPPKKIRNETTSDPNKWLEWLRELDTEPEVEDDQGDQSDIDVSDGDDVDYVVESEHDTSSEEEAEDLQSYEVDSSEESPGNFFFGKDKTTQWSKSKPISNVRTRSCNIVIHLPGPKGIARKTTEKIDILKLFLNDEVLTAITRYTNIYIESIKEKFQRARDASPTDIVELRAFFGLLYIIGSLRCSRTNLHKMWDNSKGQGLESCYLTMSEKIFRFLIRCLRFDDIRDRDSRKESDKLAPIREISDLFLSSFKKYFTPSEYLTVDEQLLSFRGRCPFRQYIPKKPAKYGLKVFALVDSKTFYTINLEPYAGKQTNLGTSAKDVVLRLVEPIQGTYRNVTGDNWFTSLELSRSLLYEKKLTYVGTIRSNRREVPSEFLPSKKKSIYSSIFGFQKDSTLVSYCPKISKSVVLLSTMHLNETIDNTTGDARKPEIVTFYNSTKVGVDVLDQLCQNYNVSRNTRRWPMVLFYNLLNISAINSLVIYKANNIDTKIKRVDFLEEISWELVKPQIQRRSAIASLPNELKRRSKVLLGEIESPPPTAERKGLRGRCYMCGRARDKTTRKWCTKCENWVCGEHLKEVCMICHQN